MNKTGNRPAAGARYAKYLRVHELPLLIGLVLMWMMLWQSISWLSLASGVLIAVAVTRLFYLPPVELAGRINVLWTLWYLIWFFWNMFLSSLEVAWAAIRVTRPPKSAIIEVQLHTKSDFIITLTGMTISLIPGSLVVDVDRFGSTLYLHVLDVPTKASQEKFRAQVHKIEKLLLRAIGSRRELETCR